MSADDTKRENLVSDKELLRFSLSYLKPRKHIVVFSIFLILITSLLALTPELMIKKILDSDIPSGNRSALLFSVFIMVGIYVASWLLRFVYSYVTSKLEQSTVYDLRMDGYEKLLNQSQTYFDKNHSGQINSRLTNDLETLANFLGSSLIDIIASVISLIGIVSIMLFLDLTLSLISFLLIPLLVLLAYFLQGPVRRTSRETRKTIAVVTSNLSENINGAKTTKTFAREKKNLKDFDKVNKENYQANMNATKLFALIFPLVGLITAFGTAVILYYSGYQASHGNSHYTVGLVATFMAYLTRFFGPVMSISMFYSSIQSALASLERVYLFVNEDIAVTDDDNATEMEATKGSISFQDVTFGYTDDTLFDNLTIELEGGKVTALCGETGAGKSTFAKLIPRFYDLNSGSISIDGTDITTVTQKSLRKHIAIVPQTTHLFNTSIIENLKYGSHDVTEERVIEISKMVGLHDFVNALPHGYETVVKEGGSRLSNGQRQLIAFARALIKDPKILILDEATSSLDPISEIRVQRALNKVIEGRTVLAIAHRLSTVRNADRIIVIDDGKIIQDGNHSNLVRKSGKYQELYLKQFLEKDETELLSSKITQ